MKKMSLTTDNALSIEKRISKLLSDTSNLQMGSLEHVVEQFISRREDFLKIASSHKTPCYVLDVKELHESIEEFQTAFHKYIPNFYTYFAVKTNNHPFLLQTVTDKGLGLDISSIREFTMAKKAGCKKMIYTGPGKTVDDLMYVITNEPQVIIQMDSFGELERLGEVTSKLKKTVKAGIRIITSTHSQWSKFGIPLKYLARLWKKAKKYKYIELQGIQFHLSWNEDAKPYQQAIADLGKYLRENFTRRELQEIKFIDFGGGFRPYRKEGTYPWATPQGEIIKITNDYCGRKTTFSEKYFITPAASIEEYASGIAAAIKKHLTPIVSCNYFAEPGRIICNSAMHILLKVVDKKDKQLVIVDGGINIVGWEKFLYEYFPIINLSKSSLQENACTIGGPLCTPDDIWGNYYYGSAIVEGDILLVPYQGHLTYSFAQNFIREIPEVYILE